MKTVSRISITPVKCLRLSHPGRVLLGPDGVAENRRFFLVGPDGQRLRSSLTGWGLVVTAEYDAGDELLRMRFPDGRVVEGSAVAGGAAIDTAAKGDRPLTGRVVPGPWEEQLSRLAGHPVRVVRPDRPGATLVEPVTLVSDGSLERLAREAGVPEVDARRFRMLFELAGCAAHEEDGWDAERFRIGEAVIRVGGPVDRCAMTTRDPETGERDLDTLRLIKSYRGQREGDGAVLFGVYATVEQPGQVRLGDRLEPL